MEENKIKDLEDDEELKALRLAALATLKAPTKTLDCVTGPQVLSYSTPINRIVTESANSSGDHQSNQIPFISPLLNANSWRKQNNLTRRRGPPHSKASQRSNLIVISPVSLEEGQDDKQGAETEGGKTVHDKFIASEVLPQFKWCGSGNEDSMSPKTLRRTGPTRFNRHGSDSESSESDYTEDSDTDSGSNETILQDEPREPFNALSPSREANDESEGPQKSRRLSFHNFESEIKSDNTESTSVYKCLKNSNPSCNRSDSYSGIQNQDVSANVWDCPAQNNYTTYSQYSGQSYSTHPNSFNSYSSHVSNDKPYRDGKNVPTWSQNQPNPVNSYYTTGNMPVSNPSGEASSTNYYSRDASYSVNVNDMPLTDEAKHLSQNDLRLELKKRMQGFNSKPDNSTNSHSGFTKETGRRHSEDNTRHFQENDGGSNSYSNRNRQNRSYSRERYRSDHFSRTREHSVSQERERNYSISQEKSNESGHRRNRYEESFYYKRHQNEFNARERHDRRSSSRDRRSEHSSFRDKSRHEHHSSSPGRSRLEQQSSIHEKPGHEQQSSSYDRSRYEPQNFSQDKSRLEGYVSSQGRRRNDQHSLSLERHRREKRSSSRGRKRHARHSSSPERSRNRSHSSSQDRRGGSRSSSRLRKRLESRSRSRDRKRHESRSLSRDRKRHESRSLSRDRRHGSRSLSRDRKRRESRSSSHNRMRRESRSSSRDRKRHESRSLSRDRRRNNSQASSHDQSTQKILSSNQSSNQPKDDSRMSCDRSKSHEQFGHENTVNKDKGRDHLRSNKRKHRYSSDDSSSSECSSSRNSDSHEHSSRRKYYRNSSKERIKHEQNSLAKSKELSSTENLKNCDDFQTTKNKSNIDQKGGLNEIEKNWSNCSTGKEKNQSEHSSNQDKTMHNINKIESLGGGYKPDHNKKSLYSSSGNSKEGGVSSPRKTKSLIFSLGKSDDNPLGKGTYRDQDNYSRKNKADLFSNIHLRQERTVGIGRKSIDKKLQQGRSKEQYGTHRKSKKYSKSSRDCVRSRSSSRSSRSSYSSSSSTDSQAKVRSIPSVVKSVPVRSPAKNEKETSSGLLSSGISFSISSRTDKFLQSKKGSESSDHCKNFKSDQMDSDKKTSENNKRVPVHMRLGAFPRKRVLQMTKDVEAAFVNSSSSSDSESVSTKNKQQKISISSEISSNKSETVTNINTSFGNEEGDNIFKEKSRRLKTYR